jgi:protein-tyrosine phosphatase
MDVYDGDKFDVLMICTANKCRSPIAEVLMRDALAEAGMSWTVSSAGVAAQDGASMDTSAAKVLGERGIAVSEWTSRRLVPALIERADLVLTAQLQHRAAVVAMVPAAIRRTFPILQFARFAAHAGPVADPRASDAALVDRVIAARGGLQPAPVGADDIADPIGKSIRHFRDCTDTIAHAVEQIVTAVSGGSPTRREASP